MSDDARPGRRYPRLTEEGKRKHLDELAYMLAAREKSGNGGAIAASQAVEDAQYGFGGMENDLTESEPEGPTGPYLST